MQSHKKTKAAAVAAAKMLLLAEGLAIGALIHGGVCLVGAHQDAIQRTIVLGITMVCALLDSTLNTLVGVTIHDSFLLRLNYSCSMRRIEVFIPAVEIFHKICYGDNNENKGAYSMAKISPSILAADFANLERDIRDIEANGADFVHVDIMDGIFVPNISIGIPVVKAIRPVTKLPLDVHLMIDRPIRYVEDFVKAGADFVTIHVEADQPQNTLDALDKIHALGCKAGIVLKPKTPAEAAIPYLEKCDMILVMTVEPGFGGQSFMADQMGKVSQLKEWMEDINPECLIEVDGGVDGKTHRICKEAGANVLVAGSAYFKAANRAEFVKMLQE